jgi:exopolysaccharide production protein ExoZ
MLKSLQIGRGLAAISVAAFHLTESMALFAGDATFSKYTDRGFLGVDFFFVLSGFIILQAHIADVGQPTKLGEYVTKRFIRIYPIYWIYLSLTIAGMIFVSSKNFNLSSPSDWLTSYLLVRFSEIQTPLRQAWTLFHEIVFYGIFGILIISKRVGIFALAIWGVCTGVMYFYPEHERPTLLGNIFSAYNLNFFVGMSAFLLSKVLSNRSAWFSLVAGIAMFALTLALEMGGMRLAIRNLAYATSFGMIVLALAVLEQSKVRISIPVLEKLGDASYSIYLLHEHLENYLLRALVKLNVVELISPELLYFMVLAVTAWLGYLAYVFIERPLLIVLRSTILGRGK